MRHAALALCLVLLLSACSNVTTPDMPDFMQGMGGGSQRDLALPGQYVGSGDSAAATQGRKEAEIPPDEAQLRAMFEQRNRQATALWNRAEAMRGAEAKADVYEDIADDFPEYPRAAEARYRQGVHLYEAREWMDSIEAFKNYMLVAPVNPHVPEVEEKIYRAALARLADDGGFFAIFRDESEALDALRYVGMTFPAGEYPDDALLTIGRYYQKDPEELQRAMLYFKELLLRYPDSEWSFEARRALGDTYALRDQGTPYHAGFVDRDPREQVPDDEKAEAHAGPVRSGLEMAVEEYDKYLERIERDPGRQAEYTTQVEQVSSKRQCAREALAQKDLRTAAWYASRGEQRAAEVYRRSAAMWRGQEVEPLPTADCAVPFPNARAPSAVAGPASPGGVTTLPPGAIPPNVTPGTRPTGPATPLTFPPVPTPTTTPNRVPGTMQPPPPPPPSDLGTVRAPAPSRPPSVGVPTPRPPVSPAPVVRVPATSGRVPPPPPPPAWTGR